MGTQHLAEVAAGPFLALCAVLAVAGVAKVRSGTGSARLLGGVEIAVAAIGIAFGRAGALAVAACYLVFAGYALRLVLRAPERPCGCLGAASDAPATPAHVAVDLAAAVVAVGAAGATSPLRVLGDQPLAGVPFLVLVACAAWLVALVLDTYPRVRAATRLATQEGRA